MVNTRGTKLFYVFDNSDIDTVSGVLLKTDKREEVVNQLHAGMYIIDGAEIFIK